MVLLQGNNLAHHIINCPSPFLLQGMKPSLHLYHKGCHPSHPSLQGNHFPNQILLGNHMEYPISSLLLHGLVDMRVISIGELFNGWGLVLKIQLCLSLLTHKMHLSFQSTWIEKSILILILMTCTIQTLSGVTSMTLLHHQMKVYSPLIHIPLPSSPSNPFILHPLQDWMLPRLPGFVLWVAWNIMDLCNLIYQCLLCQVLILMILMTMAMMTLQVSPHPLLHTHLHLFRILIQVSLFSSQMSSRRDAGTSTSTSGCIMLPLHLCPWVIRGMSRYQTREVHQFLR